jgi:hypothetical protein
VEIGVALSANFTFFNGLLLFAQFQGNRFFPRRQFVATREPLHNAKLIKSNQCESGTQKYSRSCDVAPEISAGGNKLVPLRRALKANFDDLVRIGDVVPTSVGLPTFGNHLNESAAERSFRDVGDAIAVSFDI